MNGLDRAEAERLFEQRAVRSDPDECWIWFGSINPKGYGTLSCRGVPLKAHRVSWWLFKGDIPDGLFVLHRCDVRDCVNPNHLFLGTHQDNMDDMREKGRARNGFTKEGGKLPILTRKQIKQVREFYDDECHPTYEELAFLYEVSVGTIYRAVSLF